MVNLNVNVSFEQPVNTYFFHLHRLTHDLLHKESEKIFRKQIFFCTYFFRVDFSFTKDD